MRQRVGLVVLSSFLSLSIVGASAPRREPPPPPPKKAPAEPQQPQPRPQLVITEIMYDPSSGETEDVQTEWVEIHNRSPQAANLKGFQITSGAKGKIHDPKQRFVLGEVVVAAGEHAVIGIGASSCYGEFKLPPFAAHCGETKYAWLGNTGDSVAIRDGNGRVIDEVVYETEPPWPGANRGGGTIQFIAPEGEDPLKANDDPKNWVACNAHNSDEFKGHGRGTPGGPPKATDATTQPVAAKKK